MKLLTKFRKFSQSRIRNIDNPRLYSFIYGTCPLLTHTVPVHTQPSWLGYKREGQVISYFCCNYLFGAQLGSRIVPTRTESHCYKAINSILPECFLHGITPAHQKSICTPEAMRVGDCRRFYAKSFIRIAALVSGTFPSSPDKNSFRYFETSERGCVLNFNIQIISLL